MAFKVNGRPAPIALNAVTRTKYAVFGKRAELLTPVKKFLPPIRNK